MSGNTSTPNTVFGLSVVWYTHSAEKAWRKKKRKECTWTTAYRRVPLLGTFKPGSSHLGFRSVGRDAQALEADRPVPAADRVNVERAASVFRNGKTAPNPWPLWGDLARTCWLLTKAWRGMVRQPSAGAGCREERAGPGWGLSRGWELSGQSYFSCWTENLARREPVDSRGVPFCCPLLLLGGFTRKLPNISWEGR